MNDPWMPFLAAAVALVLLVFLQRWIHAHLHGVSLLLTGRAELALVVYAIILFPGVLLHEASHWLSATLLGVRTGGVSLLPRRQPDGTLQLGYVEYYRGRTLDPLRESLIGGAPLIAGYIRTLAATQRLRIEGMEHFDAAKASGRPIVFAFWHEDLFNIEIVNLRFGPKGRVAVMISRSRNGEM
ncbi:MAG TPA: hypothetical protein PLH39_10945, partial [Promineifilum sp.]|nr:hypothetical protein [Promineifilum sp.]